MGWWPWCCDSGGGGAGQGPFSDCKEWIPFCPQSATLIIPELSPDDNTNRCMHLISGTHEMSFVSDEEFIITLGTGGISTNPFYCAGSSFSCYRWFTGWKPFVDETCTLAGGPNNDSEWAVLFSRVNIGFACWLVNRVSNSFGTLGCLRLGTWLNATVPNLDQEFCIDPNPMTLLPDPSGVGSTLSKTIPSHPSFANFPSSMQVTG